MQKKALEGKNIVMTGVSEGGYGGAIAKEAANQGANVFATSSNPTAKKEEEIQSMGANLIETPLDFNLKLRENTQRQWESAKAFLQKQGVKTIDGLVLCHAGGMPRSRQEKMQHAVLIGKIFEQRAQLSDFPRGLMENIAYVDAFSYQDIIEWSQDLLSPNAPIIATSYRDQMPGYIIAPFKRALEKIMQDFGKKDLNTIAVALPEALTPATNMFRNVMLLITHNYIEKLKNKKSTHTETQSVAQNMQEQLESLANLDLLLEEIKSFFQTFSTNFLKEYEQKNFQTVSVILKAFFAKIENLQLENILKESAQIISDFVRTASAQLTVEQFLIEKDFTPGETRLVQYDDLLEKHTDKIIDTNQDSYEVQGFKETPIAASKQETKKLLSMYGDKFRLIDEFNVSVDGKFARGIFKVPTKSEEFDFLRDHFKNMPILPGAVQVEAASQLCVAVGAKQNQEILPLLTGLENISFDTLSLPGDILEIEVEQIEAGKRQEKWRFKIEVNEHVTTGEVSGMPIKKNILEKRYQENLNQIREKQLAEIHVLETRLGKTIESSLKSENASVHERQLLINSLKGQIKIIN